MTKATPTPAVHAEQSEQKEISFDPSVGNASHDCWSPWIQGPAPTLSQSGDMPAHEQAPVDPDVLLSMFLGFGS